MAVYKATYCNPFLDNVDIRVTVDESQGRPCKWLTCKIDSSNKKITGYKIRILDASNNQIFPSSLSNNGEGYISPISELPSDSSDAYVNSGLNGTILKIPFFQNYHCKLDDARGILIPSLNAVYYTPFYSADYVLRTFHPQYRIAAYDNDHISIYGGIADSADSMDHYMVGDTVLSTFPIGIDDETVCDIGIFKITSIITQSRQHTVSLVRVTGMDSSALEGQKVVILKGTLHDTVYSFDDQGQSSEVIDHSGLWVDFEGHPLDFTINGGSYKWEITLYQEGDTAYYHVEVVFGQIEEPGEEPVDFIIRALYIEYRDEDFNNYDAVLNSGKILGSTNKRIQVASSLNDNAVLPLGSIDSPLVLQGSYAQLIDSNGNYISSRAYVQNYDTTYGHVYPITGSFSREDIDSAEKICFYKHSNNAEDVLAKERVTCATTSADGPNHDGNIPIYQEIISYSYVGVFSRFDDYWTAWHNTPGGLYRKDGNSYIFCEATMADWGNTTPYYKVTSRQWQMNPDLGLLIIDGFQIKEGDIVLVKDQTRSCENGVYIAHQTGAAWSRSSSYKNWGDYIGAILFVMNGDTNGSTNWQSTASAGGSLFNIDLTSGESPLIFIPEKPITLFPENIAKNVSLIREKMPHETIDTSKGESETHYGNSYEVFLVLTDAQHNLDLTKIQSDGVTFAAGQRIYCCNNSHNIIEITYFDQEGETAIIEYSIVDQDTEVDDYLNVASGGTYGGHIVKVLSNSVTIDDDSFKKAYILKNGVTHTYISPYIGLRKDMALKLLNNQEVAYADNSTSQWIKIDSSDSSIKSINTVTWCIKHEALEEPLASDSPVDTRIPFTYEVRTFYRASDENPFYTFEEPYLRIRKTYPLEGYEPLSARYATFEAAYRQFQQTSWETYRWVLFDPQDNILQDTGLKYDRDIKVTFYGLSNEYLHNSYKVGLYVTDDKKNDVSAEVNFEVGEGTETFSSNFSAELDCSTHSIKLTYLRPQGSDVSYSFYRREYQKYERLVKDPVSGENVMERITYQGPWKPVALETKEYSFRDFNITAGHSYQYIMYPVGNNTAVVKQQFANAIRVSPQPYYDTGVPVVTSWNEWSLAELKPVENVVDAPILRKTFEVDLDNIWLFKYSLETGNQVQNFQKSEVQTLGKFQKFGYGRMNYVSGDVSCLLGSGIVPYTKIGYVERMRKSITIPLSTNDRAYMLEQWRKIASSPNPKLLTDMKGQSWIVQITSNSNSPKNFYYEQPDTISFSWKQIDSTDGVVIVGSGATLADACESIWKKVL